MLKIEKADDRVRVTGKGLELLKATSVISNFLDGSALDFENRDSFLVDLNVYIRARPMLIDLVSEDEHAESLVESEMESIKSHSAGRRQVHAFRDAATCSFGVEYWDDLLDAHQIIAAKSIAVPGLKGLCLFDEQGTGKTVSAIAGFDLLRHNGDADSMVIVAPKTLIKNWGDEISRFLPAPNDSIVIEGAAEDKYRKLMQNKIAYLVTYETLERQLEVFTLLSTRKKIFLVVDESFNVKNPDALRSVALRTLRKTVVRCIVLCGTPAPNAPIDLIHQFDLADNGFTFGGCVIPDEAERQRAFIKNRIDSRGTFLRRVKEDVLPDLPQKKFHVTNVDMTPNQSALYLEAKKQLVIYLKTLDNRQFKRSLATYFQKRSVLLQICSDPHLVDPLFNEVSAKFLALDSILKREIDGNGKKVVVWAAYKRTIDALLARYSSYRPVRIDGEVTSAEERHQNVQRFQSDPNVRLFVGNAAAAGAGITLHASSLAIYFSWSNQAAHYMQSIDRIHRRGQSASEVIYNFIVSNDTLEVLEIQRLLDKQKIQSDLMGDRVDDGISLEEALRELES